jgi:hypothetical protein
MVGDACQPIISKMKENGSEIDFISATTGIEKNVIEEL